MLEEYLEEMAELKGFDPKQPNFKNTDFVISHTSYEKIKMHVVA